MDTPIIRKIKKETYVLAHTEIEERGSELYKNTYWLQCDDEGNILDEPKNKTLLCKIPKGYDDFDVTTLKEDCLKESK